jgi:hypothetical protein
VAAVQFFVKSVFDFAFNHLEDLTGNAQLKLGCIDGFKYLCTAGFPNWVLGSPLLNCLRVCSKTAVLEVVTERCGCRYVSCNSDALFDIVLDVSSDI